MDSESNAESLMKEETIKKLSEGILEVYEEPLVKVSASLKELTMKQKALIDIVVAKNQNLQSSQNNANIKKMFSDITRCKEQLILIKKQMILLHERSGKLKVRAHNVLTYAKNRHSVRSAELENEQKLIGSHKS